MINYALFVQTEDLLLEISSLTSKLYLTAGSFSNSCLEYLNKLQLFADKYKFYFSSDISIEIQKLITYNGEPRAANSGLNTKRNIRKEKDSFAVKCLESIMKVIKIFLEKDKKTYDECSEVWRQVVARLLCKNPTVATINPIERVDSIVCQVSKDIDLMPYYSHIIGLLGVFNAKALLDTILPQLGL